MTGYYRGAGLSPLPYICYPEAPNNEARAAAGPEDIAEIVRDAGAGRVRVIDTRDGRHIMVENTADGLRVSHARHPDSTAPDQRALSEFFSILTALRRARKKFMSDSLPSSPARRRRAERRLWRLYESFYRDRTVRFCGYLRERDREANTAMERTAHALRKLGHRVRTTPAEQTNSADVRFARLISGLESAENGAELAEALRQKPEGDERRHERTAA